MRIFLIGLTGSGKSTLGKKLAAAIPTEFIDLDDYIIQKEKKSISEIFEQYGEVRFREIEAASLREVCNIKEAVISTGGGAACFHDNMTVMNVSGITVFLDVPIDALTHRLFKQSNRENRPMFKNKTEEEVRAFLNELYEKRVSFYRESKLTLQGSNISVERIIEELESID